MSQSGHNELRVAPKYRALVARLGLTAESIFADPRIRIWRSIAERENGTLDAEDDRGRPVRLHVKRHRPARGPISPADEERRGIELLDSIQIPTTSLVASGRLADGRSFIVTEDLAGFRAADKWIAEGFSFEQLLEPTADLAAQLHSRGLHHRDLYLCHFFVKPEAEGGRVEVRLIDAARVRPLPSFLTRRRWIVKDLAQFWYSTLSLSITDDQRVRWLARYGSRRGLDSAAALQASVVRKAARIGRHDARLKAAQPDRNVSIPGA